MLSSSGDKSIMVDPGGVTSNHLFLISEEGNLILQGTSISITQTF